MLILDKDEILLGISTASKESTYAEAVLTNPIYLNREICLLLTNHNGFLLFIIHCKSCKKNTVHTTKGTCCCPSHNETKKEHVSWSDYFSKHSFYYDHKNDYYPVFVK